MKTINLKIIPYSLIPKEIRNNSIDNMDYYGNFIYYYIDKITNRNISTVKEDFYLDDFILSLDDKLEGYGVLIEMNK